MSKKTPYMVIISTRTGTTIRLTNPPAALPELLRFIQDIELADIRAQMSYTDILPGHPVDDKPFPPGSLLSGESGPEPVAMAAAQEKVEVQDEKPADPRRSRFISLF